MSRSLGKGSSVKSERGQFMNRPENSTIDAAPLGALRGERVSRGSAVKGPNKGLS
jgi:hypothetical protein